MKNPLQLAINAILLIAVAVLFYLHFAQKPAVTTQPVAAATAEKTADEPADSAATTPGPSTAVVTAEADKPLPAAATNNIRKVAYVESSKLLEGYRAMQSARKEYERKATQWQKQHETNVRAFQAAVQNYQKTGAGLTEEQRAATEQRLQAQEQQVAQKQQQLQQQAQQEEGRMTEQVLGRVNKLLETYGKENDYDLILIAGSGTIAYGRKGLDITEPILKRLNAEYAAKGKK
ncbi:OmpH family outer membrane protein [Hymenobacter koreensis]|uniref:OmpH family outer membrane protein n=1 Tax=Hymenobacter koreensis TaxID=1084523 RepID=A0ABP8IUC6_9BACT